MPEQPQAFECDPPHAIDGVLIGFDFGLRRIGIAVGQSLTKTASPLTMLLANDGEPQWQAVAEIINEWRPNALVVGIPLNMDGTEQPITRKARAFAGQLKQQFKLPVFGVDERLTSFEARQRLFDAGGYKAVQKNQIDSLAASLILEGWMQEHCL
ncbi:MAG: Holliday junction resolvase RuvX [Legionellales bacterium]|nr:Holliday junction resolvase RuvX [Legionellales bacterium]